MVWHGFRKSRSSLHEADRHSATLQAGSHERVGARVNSAFARSSSARHILQFNLFSLIELLITVAIIAILASMLLPALGNAREAGRRIKCGSNMRQVVLGGLTMYAGDYDDWAFHGFYDYLGDGAKQYWVRKLSRNQGLKYLDWDYTTIGAAKGLFDCPSEFQAVNSGNVAVNFGIYGMSLVPADILLKGLGGLFKKSSVRRSSRIAWVSDSIINRAAISPTSDSYEPSRRHNNSSNVVFIDGHLQNLKRLDFPHQSFLPDYNLLKISFPWSGN